MVLPLASPPPMWALWSPPTMTTSFLPLLCNWSFNSLLYSSMASWLLLCALWGWYTDITLMFSRVTATVLYVNHFLCPSMVHAFRAFPRSIIAAFLAWITATRSSASPSHITPSASAVISEARITSHPLPLMYVAILFIFFLFSALIEVFCRFHVMMLSLFFLLKTSLFVLSLLNFLSLLLALFLSRRVRVSAVPNKSAIPSTSAQPRLTAVALLHSFLLRLSLLRGPGLGWIVCSFQPIQASTARLLLCSGLERPLPVVCRTSGSLSSPHLPHPRLPTPQHSLLLHTSFSSRFLVRCLVSSEDIVFQDP